MAPVRTTRNIPWLAAALLICAAACAAILANGMQASAGLPPGSYSPLATATTQKVARSVLDETASGQTAQFMVLMSEQADLSAAYKMTDQDARGWYVYNTLRATADRTQANLKARLASGGVPYTSYWVANALLVEGDRVVVDSLAARSDVAHIESNRPFKGFNDPVGIQNAPIDNNSPDTVEWGVTRVNAPQVWAMGFTGQGIVIANQDTGMRWTHNAIKPKYRGWNGSVADHNYNWWDSIHSGGGACGANTQAPCDDHGHGTHTTGTTSGDDGAGNQVGVAPGAKWIGCRNMNVGAGTPATYTECFQFFIAPTDLAGQNPNPALRPHVMNNSWGCPTSEGCGATTLNTIINNTQASGIFVEASNGNDGPSCSSVNASGPPALTAGAFSTGALDINNSLAGFSSRGPVTADGSNRMKPNISAPGVNVRSSVNTSDTSYSNFSGTSMAGPHVVGVVALLWSAHPELSRMITETRTLLQNTANPQVVVTPETCGGIPSSTIPNNSFGYGLVDALAAVSAATTPTATPTGTITPPPPTNTPTITPTRTNTTVPTPTIAAVVRAHVLLQGRPTPPSTLQSVPVTLTLRSTSGADYADYPATTDSAGYFTVTLTVPSGDYEWRVKNPQTLSAGGTSTFAGGPNSLEVGTLAEGDANNDNCVNASDFAVLSSSFGKGSGDPGYDPRADFNGDGIVSSGDFNLLRGSFGLCGPPPL